MSTRPHGGVSLDLSRMNNVLAVNADDLDCVVEPGVTRKQLNEHLRDSGLFFPIDPGADASLGGMAATRASGTNAVRYGTMKDVVLSLGVVAADGSFLRTGTRAKKSSAGYDLTHMFIGSEGTLGTIVEVALKLSGIPEAIAAGHCSFPSIRAACETTIETIQSGLPIARIELIDTLSVRAFNTYSHLALPEQPLLLVEFHGTEQSVAEQASRFGDIAASHGGGAFASATKPEDRTKLWQARHDTYWSQLTLRPGARPFATDACVPISRLADCVEETLEDIKLSGLIAPIVGHVGDGNFHVTPLVDLENKAEIEAADAFASPPRPSRHRHGGHLHRRARRRPEEAGIYGGGAWGRSPSTSCAASKPRSTRRTCSIRARCSTPDGRVGRRSFSLSFPRKPESRASKRCWMPAFAGMTGDGASGSLRRPNVSARGFEEANGEERRFGVGFLGVGSARSANRRQIHGQWAAAADRVLPHFGGRTADAGDRRNLWRALQDLFGAERARKPRCGEG